MNSDNPDKTFRRIEKKIRRQVWDAVDEFEMIVPGDKVMVCLSGGKDSYTMLSVLLHMQRMRQDFEIVAVNLDQKQPGFPEQILPDYLTSLDIPFKIVEKDTYSIVKRTIPEGKTMCSLCSRLRRGNLYTIAKELNATKIALGHHRDDLLETFFLNLFFSGKIETMPPKYETDNKEHILIRPLCTVKETDIQLYSNLKEYPIIPCTLCGTQPNLQRGIIKKMLQEWEKQYPQRSDIIFSSLKRISPSHMMDPKLWDFKELLPIMQFESKEKAADYLE